MADSNVSNSEIGYLGLPIKEISNCSIFQENQVVGSAAIRELVGIEWNNANVSAQFQSYDGLASGFTKYVADTKQDSIKATFSTVAKQADPYLLPLGFQAFTLDDIARDPDKLGALVADISAAMAYTIEGLAMTAFGTTANKTVVANPTVKISLDMVNAALASYGVFQSRPNKTMIVHPDVYSVIKGLAGSYNVAGTDSTLVSGEISKFAGCQLAQSSQAPAPASGVYKSYIVLPGTYQWGTPVTLDLTEKTERGKLEKYLDCSYMYVDNVLKPIGGTIKRVLELTHKIV